MRSFLIFLILNISFSITVFAQMAVPKVKEYKPPIIPAAAIAVQASGAVRISVEIDDKGTVVRAVAKSGHPLLRGACISAARSWIFSKSKGTTGTRMTDIVFEISYDRSRSKNKVKFEKPNVLRVAVARNVTVNL